MKKETFLKQLLNLGETLIMPDAYDPISAKVIEYAGFSAIQCSGYSYSISKGYKSESSISLQTNLDITKEIVEAVNIPVMADGEDGYGEDEYFSNVIKKFIYTGVSGINIEDQNHKLHSDNLEIYTENEMLNKLKIATKTKNDLGKNDFILNFRTDALLTCTDRKEGIKIAIERANKYLEAGADICFIAYVKTLEEIKLLSKEINGPISIASGLPYNIKEFSIKDCIQLGIARVSLPTFMIFNSIEYMTKKLIEIKATEDFSEIICENSLLLNRDLLQNILNNKK